MQGSDCFPQLAKAAAEQTRRAEIEEEIKNLPDEREIESQAIAQQLTPLNMTIHEVAYHQSTRLCEAL